MISIDNALKAEDLANDLKNFWKISGDKILLIEKDYDETLGSPVFTIAGKYSSRGWTEWTQGFQYGSAIIQFDATGETDLLEISREKVLTKMANHVSHTGVHDHGFNNISTYGNLLRLMNEGKIPFNEWERNFYEMALKVSGAVQASRWTPIKNGGFIHSFNGPHSLFVDTIRSCRSLIVSHMLGQVLQTEGDRKINLLERAIQHMLATAAYSVYYGEGRDIYDINGRTAHEIIFNIKDGSFRCSNSQQGYSGFTTWTRALSWAICGFSELLEYIQTIDDSNFMNEGGKKGVIEILLKAATATSDYYIESSPTDGIPYWDTGAPNLYKLGDYLNQPANPYNDFEPVDSSAASISAQGLLRLGRFMKKNGNIADGSKYWQAGLGIVKALLKEPYISLDPKHQGLILHSVYHRPNGWDYIPAGSKVPNGESSMWGDYHMREVCLYLKQIINEGNYYAFYNCIK